MTRFSHLHPYPGMISDALAQRICQRLVTPGQSVLDPFCGTGRTLIAAAEMGASAVGVDINPLAVVIASAKSVNCRMKRIENIKQELTPNFISRFSRFKLNFEQGRKVKWFSKIATRELSSIIEFLNSQRLGNAELQLIASILSATVRDVCYCRKDQWKIHRMSAKDRMHFKRRAVPVFAQRLNSALRELKEGTKLGGNCVVLKGDATDLTKVLGIVYKPGSFDLVITSPPYGDSRTTVQYGGLSSLCMSVVRHLKGMGALNVSTSEVDRKCLGGCTQKTNPLLMRLQVSIGKFWLGCHSTKVMKRVLSFCEDYALACVGITHFVKPKGHAVFVVARRHVGGHELKLDQFTIDVMGKLGWTLIARTVRNISGKVTPYLIRRSGGNSHSWPKKCDVVPTMRREIILEFRKGKNAAISKKEAALRRSNFVKKSSHCH